MTGLVGTVNKENKEKSIHFKFEEPYIKAMTVEYVHKAKTMHEISLSLRVSKSGVTVVTSSAVERGLVLVLFVSHNITKCQYIFRTMSLWLLLCLQLSLF